MLLQVFLIFLLGLKNISYAASIGIEKGNILEMHENSLPSRSPSLPIHFVLELSPSLPLAISTLSKLAHFVVAGECISFFYYLIHW